MRTLGVSMAVLEPPTPTSYGQQDESALVAAINPTLTLPVHQQALTTATLGVYWCASTANAPSDASTLLSRPNS